MVSGCIEKTNNLTIIYSEGQGQSMVKGSFVGAGDSPVFFVGCGQCPQTKLHPHLADG